ncbi:MAG: cation:proton antiporter, partial [Acidobacteriota bacterium]
MAYLDWLVPTSIFILICFSAHRIGHFFIGARLPLITGFLATGILVGPFVLELLSAENLKALHFVDDTALAFIAFAAGAELHYRELRSRLKSIGWTTLGLVATTSTAVVIAVLALADHIPFVDGLGPGGRLAVALLAGSVLVARSPSSAIAVVNELRARGPFTKTVLGVTVVMDVVVIVLFGLNSSIAGVLLQGSGFRPSLIALVVGEVLLTIACGIALGRLLPWLTRLPGPGAVRNLAVLTAGFAVFTASEALRHGSADVVGVEIFLEPLLMCMVAGFTIANFSDRRTNFQRVLDVTGPGVYVGFFTLAGASLEFDTLLGTWLVALALFATRFAAVFVGSFLGGWMAGDPMRLNRIA